MKTIVLAAVPAALVFAFMALSAARRSRRSSSGRLRMTMSRLPVTTCSRLLKSCATPPVSWPTVSIFCA